MQAAGLSELLQALSTLPAAEPLTQEIPRSGAHTLKACHRGEQGEIVGAVLYGRPQVPLLVPPATPPTKPRRRPRRFTGQLDLFAAKAEPSECVIGIASGGYIPQELHDAHSDRSSTH